MIRNNFWLNWSLKQSYCVIRLCYSWNYSCTHVEVMFFNWWLRCSNVAIPWLKKTRSYYSVKISGCLVWITRGFKAAIHQNQKKTYSRLHAFRLLPISVNVILENRYRDIDTYKYFAGKSTVHFFYFFHPWKALPSVCSKIHALSSIFEVEWRHVTFLEEFPWICI